MTKRPSKILVIDAAVLRSAGVSDKSDQRSARCREFLLGMRRICHKAILTPEIKQEWDKHQSSFSKEWRVSMTNLQKIVQKRIENDEVLREAINEASPDQHIARILIKDVRLIEGAIAADLIVISLDDTARQHFSNASIQIYELKHICWINPNVKSNQYIKWMEEGARPLEAHKLGR